ncbi:MULTISPECIES: chitosanase [unclassified Microbacterium]|uniref:chitosanase n=1 Tax=unclassified Microbacterium TaxID=2609290 RepID=UPI0030164114
MTAPIPPAEARRGRRRAALLVILVIVVSAAAGFGIWAIVRGATASSVTLRDPVKREIAMEIVASAENSTLAWYDRYDYIEDIGDERGYTGGLVGFTSGTRDVLMLVERYTEEVPGNALAAYLPALRAVDGTDSHEGLGAEFEEAWRAEAAHEGFQQAQRDEVARLYLDPAVDQALADGLGVLGQFTYFDAMVMHGDSGFASIREQALDTEDSPVDGGDEAAFLGAFLDARVVEMRREAAHEDTSRIDTAQRVFLDEGNFGLEVPLRWSVYGDPYEILRDPTSRW